eukprot:6480251-Amphidinium_carterae.1
MLGEEVTTVEQELKERACIGQQSSTGCKGRPLQGKLWSQLMDCAACAVVCPVLQLMLSSTTLTPTPSSKPCMGLGSSCLLCALSRNGKPG